MDMVCGQRLLGSAWRSARTIWCIWRCVVVLIFLLHLLHLWYRMMELPSFSKYMTWRISSLYGRSVLWFGGQISGLPQETCHDQTSIVGASSISGPQRHPVWAPPRVPNLLVHHPTSCSHSTARAKNLNQGSCRLRGGYPYLSSSPSHTLERHDSKPCSPYSPPPAWLRLFHTCISLPLHSLHMKRGHTSQT